MFGKRKADKKIPHERLFDRWAGSYDRTLVDYGYAVPEQIFQAAWPYLKDRPEPVLNLLDLGIGTGQCSRPFRATGRVHITGVDVSNRMLDSCRRQGIADELIQLNVDRDDLPFADGSFDVVIAGGVMEFISEPTEFALEIGRVLRPGGTLAVTFETPRTRDIYKPGFFQGVLEQSDDHAVIQRFTIQKLRPSLYKKYLYTPELIEAIFADYRLTLLQMKTFEAYQWPGGTGILYDLFIGYRQQGNPHSFL